MSHAPKYLFDRCFAPANGRGGGGNKLDRRPPEFERELAEARAAAFEEGRVQGERAARAAQEAQLAKTATALAERAEAMAGEVEGECAAIRTQAVKVALAAAERLSREFLRREPEAEIAAAFAECTSHVTTPSHLSIHVGAEIAESLRRTLADIAMERGFTGKLTVTGDADMAPGDCRIEWADGGVARNFEAVRARIDEALDGYLAARASAPRPNANATDTIKAAGDTA